VGWTLCLFFFCPSNPLEKTSILVVFVVPRVLDLEGQDSRFPLIESVFGGFPLVEKLSRR
jgi:hypothetical protein